MQQIADWLKKLGMAEYAQRFAENGIEIDVLSELTDQDLEKLGVLLGHRRRMLRAIRELGSTSATLPSTPLATEPIRQDAAERRQLTVMFCDLVGSTALSGRLDPEDLRGIIGAYHRCCTDLIERNGGFVAKYMGDGMLAYFGYPRAHEHDAERAIRAGLGLIDAVPKLVTNAGLPLQVRIGIATGLVVVGDLIGSGEAQERGIVGETPNLAARLQGIAEPGGVVIASSTRSLIGGLFEYEDLGTVDVKGFAESVRAWRVYGESAVDSRYEALRRHSGETPLVGREEEIELLLRRWQQAKGGEGRVVLLTGEPGIGKSRLAATLQQYLQTEPHTRLQRFCSPHHQDSAFHPIITQLERAAGIKRDDAPGSKREKLEALLAPASPPGEDVTLMAELLSIPTVASVYPALNLTPQRKKEKTFEALLRQLAGLARQRPVLGVYEDVHWIDPSSRELLDLTVERVRHLPVLLLITFRPEFQAPWTGQPHVTMLALSRLDHRAGIALAERIVGNKTLPSNLVEEIVGRTDGVPLFIEELTKAVLESRVLREQDGPYLLDGTPPLAIPTTLHASLMARLDHLAPAKEVAQMGAAIGREFSYRLLSAIARRPDQELQLALDQLVRAGLMFRRGTPPQATFLFKHALVQDVAYSTLLRDPRRDLHARIAGALETDFAEMVQMQPELLAHHCTQAGLRETAVDYWLKAGQLALTRSATTEAIAQLQKGLQGLDGLPDEPARDHREIDLQIALGEAFTAAKGLASPEMRSAYERARELCRRTGDTSRLLPALYGVWTVQINRAEVTAAVEAAQDLLRAAREQGGAAAEWIGHRCIGASRLFRGEFGPARTHHEHAMALYERTRQGTIDAREDDPNWSRLVHDAAGASLSMLPWALLQEGYPDRALTQSQAAIAAARRFNDPYALAAVLHRSCVLHQLRGDRQALVGRAAELIALTTEQGYAHWLATGTIFRGWGVAVSGEREAGAAEMRRGLAAKQATGAQLKVPYYLGLIASQVDRAPDALPILAEALARVERTGERWFEAELHRLWGEQLLRFPNSGSESADAEGRFRRALAVARDQQARFSELRVATSLARLWRDQGKQQQARELLAPVYGWFTEGFDTLDLKEAKALLDALAS